MSRRASLPGAAELFRATSATDATPAVAPAAHRGVGAVPPVREVTAGGIATGEATPGAATPGAVARGAVARGAVARGEAALGDGPDEPTRLHSAPSNGARSVRSTRRVRTVGEHAPTGRERHEEKITVYCSAEELLDLESARLHLRAEHGMAVDRGRIVREAVAVVLADLQAKGDASILVRRLREP